MADGSGGASVGEGVFREHVGAREAAMGGAATAWSGGPVALFYNPAGLAVQSRHAVFGQYTNSILDIDRSDLAYARPFLSGGLGLSVSYVDYGAITRTTTTNKTGAGTFSPNDLLVKAGYAWMLSEEIYLGGALGFYNLDLVDESASGVTSDWGVTYAPINRNWSLAAAVRNLGTKAKFFREEEDLPLSLTLGGAWDPFEKVSLAADYEFVRSSDGAFKAGAEFRPVDILALRAGYDGRNDAGDGWTAGLGLAWDDIRFDYAYVPFGDLEDAHRISAQWEFGAPVERRETTRSRELESRAPRTYSAPTPNARYTAAPRPEPSVSREPQSEPSRHSDLRPVNQSAPTRVLPVPESSVSITDVIERGNMLARDGEFDRAAAEYRRALQNDPDNPRARFNLASVLYKSARYHDAIREYHRHLALNPNDIDANLYLGMAYYKIGYRQEALESWHRVLALDPDNPTARRNTASLESS